jgi:hydroxypyruvate isomerase
MQDGMSRRDIMVGAAAGVAVAALGVVPVARGAEEGKAVSNGRVNQSVCQWCFSKFSVEDLAKHAVSIGLKGIDLVGPEPEHFAILKKYNLIGTMTKSHSISPGLNRKENWGSCLAAMRHSIDANVEAGFPNVICFSGNREGMADDEGLKNCAEALKQIVGYAEEKKITLCMELLNSKRDHKDYMCDNTAWGVELVKKVGSERFKLLYDIYHMQVQEGNVIATIQKHKDSIGHYHTAGVPGRNEIDDSQELYYPAVMKAIVETGFKGYVAQEFIPKRDPMASLAQAAKICDV